METKPKFRPNPKAKLMDQVREVLRYHHYAYRTEQTYCQWILRYIYHFGGKTHPKNLTANDVERFLSHLATEGKVAASTQRQALNALVFLYRDVLDLPLQEEIAPISDVRGGEQYKRLLLRQLLLAHFQKLVPERMHAEVWV